MSFNVKNLPGGVSKDIIKVIFTNPVTNKTAFTIEIEPGNTPGDFTELVIEKDYFIPANRASFVIKDDRVPEYFAGLQRGFRAEIYINNKPNMAGYIFNIEISYSKTTGSGTELKIECKDLLEYMRQGTVFPNMGGGSSTNFHFPPTTKLGDALAAIAFPFSLITGNDPIVITDDDTGSLETAIGKAVGIAQAEGGNSISIQNQLKSLTTPNPDESYLGYMERLAKTFGFNIKMSNKETNTIIVKPPTYDRKTQPLFQLTNRKNTNTIQNNIIDAHYKFNLNDQPSIVVIEANTRGGDGKFYQGILKGIGVNELVGYRKPISSTAQSNAPQPITNVLLAFNQLTNGKFGSGFKPTPFNSKLYNWRANLPIDISTQASLPYYTVSSNAHEGVQVATAKKLAEIQDKYCEFTFKVQGWTMPGSNAVWQPDMMVNISDDLFPAGTNVPDTIQMWIKRTTFTKSREGGTETELICTIPYTHNFAVY